MRRHSDTTDMQPTRSADAAAPDMPAVHSAAAPAASAPSSFLSALGARRLHELLLLLLFLCGMLCCLITGFSIPVYPSVLAVGLPAASLLARYLIPASGRRLFTVGRCIAAGLCVLWCSLRTEVIGLGLQHCAASVCLQLCRGFPGLTMPHALSEHAHYLQNAQTNDLLYSVMRAPISETVLFLALIFGLIWVFFYRILENVWLCAALPMPAFILCFLIIDATIPALWALFCLLLYWILILFTRISVSLDARAVSSQLSFLLVPCLLFLLAVYAWYPKTTPVGTIVGNGYDRVLNALSTIETTVSDMANGLFSGGWFSVSSEGDTISFDSLKPRQFFGRTVMRAKCDTTGVVYLREKTFGRFTEEGWEPTVFDGTNALAPNPDIQNTTSAILASAAGTSPSRLTLDGARAPLLFTPYYFHDASVPYAFADDGRIENPTRQTEYEIMFYRFSGEFGDLSYDSLEAAAAGMRLTDYFKDSISAYLEIDAALRSRLLSILEENGITVDDILQTLVIDHEDYRVSVADGTMWDTVADITRFVRGTASYSLNADVNQTDKNFVLWFLEDAEYGYCTHFATAEVMLLRACGIPARLASGYLCSIRSPHQWSAIKDSSAHAWAEVFDARLGWIPVEATPPSALSDDMDDDRIIVGMSPIAAPTTQNAPDSAEPSETAEPAESETEAATAQDTAVPSDTAADTASGDTQTEDDTKDSSGIGVGGGGLSDPLLRICGTVLLILLCAVSLLLLLLFIRGTRYARTMQLTKPLPENRNACALQLYRRCAAIAREQGKTLPAALTACAEKARFSNHTLTEEEFGTVCGYYLSQCEEMRTSDRTFKRLRHFWVDVYY